MESLRVTVPEIWPGQNRGKLVAGKNKKKINNEANWMVNNSAKLDRRTKQHTQFGVSASNGSRDMARTKSWQKKNEKKANWMVNNSAQLDRRTKQHTQFGVSASNGSRDMARTKSWRKKTKINNRANWMVSNNAQLDRRTKQHPQFGVSASNGSRDMARTKSWQTRGGKKNLKKSNKANWMVSNSTKLDRRTKQHT